MVGSLGCFLCSASRADHCSVLSYISSYTSREEISLLGLDEEIVCLDCRRILSTRLREKIVGLEAKLAHQEEKLVDHEKSLAFLKIELDHAPSTADTSRADVTIVVQGSDQRLYAHSFILSAKSTVFRRMFETAMREKEGGVIEIVDTTFPVMEAVIKHCYTADITFTDRVPPDAVFKVAHKYDLGLLRDTCERELKRTINSENLAKRLKMSKKFQIESIEEAAISYFRNNFNATVSHVFEELCEPTDSP